MGRRAGPDGPEDVEAAGVKRRCFPDTLVIPAKAGTQKVR
jgi:hypothetical protein